jgi:putative glycosyltransferase (TIGR04372 family)
VDFQNKNILFLIKRWVSIIIYSPFALIFKIFSIKIPYFFTERIGHLVVDPESFLKEHYLLHGKYPRCILIARPNNIANEKILEYWKKYFIVIKNPFLCRLLFPLCFHPLLKLDQYAATINATSSIYQINTSWGERDPLLKISDSDLEIGRETLVQMGLQEGDWFVCIHSREGGYSPSDEHLHSFRNIPIEDYLPAVEFIISNGGKCIRMGDSSMQPAPEEEGLIDYALSPFKSELMDIFLCSECLFFLGSNSGIFELSTLFGKPVALANMAPMSVVPRGKADLSLPMLYADSASGKKLEFSEIMQTEKGNYRTTKEFQDAGIKLQKNKPSEILELAKEQYLRTKNIYTSKDTNQVLQKKYKSLFKEGHYSFGYASKIGEDFLQRYSKLLP